MHSRLIALPAILLALYLPLDAQKFVVMTHRESVIQAEFSRLRMLDGVPWAKKFALLVSQIQPLKNSPAKTYLVGELGSMVTEGEAGAETLQTVCSLLAEDQKANPAALHYTTLANLERYEGCKVTLDLPKYSEERLRLKLDDDKRQTLGFTLKDLGGAEWSLNALRGKVVLVNFWATWCPPCRKELPEMEALYKRLGPKGLVVLTISGDDPKKLRSFVKNKFTFPVLLDPDNKVQALFNVEGIPRTFVYNREGKLAAQAIDRRTERQFLAMLKQAGLE